ncbi:hypothetical protein J1G43_10515 [Cellulomonas sp. zg-ZUI22]|uniref:hypothetical protein n=1 Tax=Cellulomonas sp. zg-ZUI22 TaxID=2816955 RepID=UPI001A94E51F|nr:hypothetical protein [Cellulomonas sp. zg-ZUI22]MBO0900396.1 hypothetical protein [Cellulomonas sp. zg-ZUI22]
MTSPLDVPGPAALRRLRPGAPPSVPLVVRRAELPASAWTGLHLDGVLAPLWRDTARVVDRNASGGSASDSSASDDAAVGGTAVAGTAFDGTVVDGTAFDGTVVDHAVDPAVRAAAFAALVPQRGTVGREAAAWVHAGGSPPDRVTVLVRSGARRPDPHPSRTTAEADLTEADVVDLGGVRVTTVLRTAVDVARWLPTEDALRVLRRLPPVGLDPADALRRLEQHAGGRGVRRARRTLRLV